MPRRPSRIPALLAIGLIGALSVAACSSGASSGDFGNGLSAGSPTTSQHGGGMLSVVAGENVWGDIAAQIGGPAVSVTSILDDPNKDPHEYETNVTDAANVAHAAVVIRNGAGYDDFLTRLLSADSPSGRTVLVVANIVGVHGSNPNPHLWYSPSYVASTARAIEREFQRRLPAEAVTLEANLAHFLSGEATVTSVIAQIRAGYAGTQVAYTERVAGYLLDAAGLVLGSPASFAQAIEDGNDPSPLDAARFQRVLSDHTVKVLLYNSQVTDAATAHLLSLARRSGVPVVGVSETLPGTALNFQTWQADQAKALLAALHG